MSKQHTLFQPEKPSIRALWWREPYASLMLQGKVETRTWNTNYRGLVLICASIKPYDDADILRIVFYRLFLINYQVLSNLDTQARRTVQSASRFHKNGSIAVY